MSNKVCSWMLVLLAIIPGVAMSQVQTPYLGIPGGLDVPLRAEFVYGYAMDSTPGGALVPGLATLPGLALAPGLAAVPGLAVRTFERASLRPMEPTPAPVLILGSEDSRRRWIDAVSLSGAVLAGALAVHYRTKADNRFEDWEMEKSPALKRDVQRLDVLSVVSVGVMQVGLGVFALRLVL